jgi:hypothetical protein
MTLLVQLSDIKTRAHMAEARFKSSGQMAEALKREAPFDRGFRLRASLEIKGKEYAVERNFAPLSDRILPADWKLTEECEEIAYSFFECAERTLRKRAPELFPAQ